MNRASPFLVGLLFGIGLCLSGMTNPGKVLAFLDLGGAWDPSLAFVMASAVAVTFIAFRIAARRTSTLSGESFHGRRQRRLTRASSADHSSSAPDGNSQACVPARRLPDIGYLDGRVTLFVLAMVAGMALYSGLAAAPSTPEVALDG